MLQHLGGGLEALVFEETVNEFAARVVGFRFGGQRVAREKHAALDVDEQRGYVDELAGGVDVVLLEVVGVLEELGGDAADGDVVDVDVLAADEVEEEVEGAVVDLAYGDAEGGLRGFVAGLVALAFGLGGWWGRGGVRPGRRAPLLKWADRSRRGWRLRGPSTASRQKAARLRSG